MTVEELIKELEKYDGDTEVMFEDCELGHCSVNKVRDSFEYYDSGKKIVELEE